MTWAFSPRAATRSLSEADAKLGALIERVGPFTLKPEAAPSTFEALARAIVYQQLSGKAAATIFGRLVAAHPRGRLTPKGLLALSDETIRGAGISRPKLASLRDLAQRDLGGEVSAPRALATMAEDDIIETLTRIRGIGRWSVEMLLMFRLGRADVLPVTDLGIQKGFQRTFGGAMPTADKILRRGERWRPYRTVASWYLWRALDAPAR